MKHFCLIGHVDTGKSTLAGHLIYKCGNIPEHEFNKQRKESPEYAFWSSFLDIYEEERVKSKTHEFSVIQLSRDGKQYSLIDTPGHKTFIRSMIEGISSIENLIGCILISAREGEFESGQSQTREDIIIARSVGIDDLVVVINKMDSVNWKQEIYDDIVMKINPFVKSCKFKSVHYIITSGIQGIGLVDNDEYPEWYHGKNLMDTLDSLETTKSDSEPIETEKWNKFSAEVLLLKGMISVGYSCIMHYSQKEYDVTVVAVKSGGKTFMREKETGAVVFSSASLIEKGTNRRILLRNSTDTIGFGKIKATKLDGY